MTKRTGRIQRLTKRSDTQQPAVGSVIFRFGAFQFDPATRELWSRGRKQELSSKTARFLSVLLEKAPTLVARDHLATVLWGSNKYADFDDRLNHVVSRLRRSLSDSADHPHYIQTSHGVGYRMIAPVSVTRAEKSASVLRNVVERAVSPIQSRPAAWLSLALLAWVAIATTIAIRPDVATTHDAARPRIAILDPLVLSYDPALNQMSEAFGKRLRSEFVELGSVDVTIPATADYQLRTAFYAGYDPTSLTLAATLITAANERLLWSDDINRNSMAINEFGSAAINEISKQVLRSVLPNEKARLAIIQPSSSETDLMYRAGKEALQAGLLNEAIEHFNSITEQDPGNALAHSDLARALIHKGWYTAAPSMDIVPRAKAAAKAALDLDPSLAEPYLTLANMSAFYDWDWTEAELLYQRAIHRNPGHAASYLDYATYLFVIGRIDDGVEQLRQAELVDPISASTHGQIGILYHYIRRWEAAHRHYDAALILEPRNVIWRMHKGCTYIFQGELQRGAEMIRELRADNPQSPMPMVIEAYYFAVTGDFENTRRLLNELDAAELPPLTELMRASIFVAMGYEAEAVQVLRDSRDKRLLALPLTAIHPTHDPLRTRGDYRALLTDLGLEEHLSDQLAKTYPATRSVNRNP